MRRGVRIAVVMSASLALAGCFAGPKSNPPPPADWGKPAATRIGECPLIAGVYGARGQLALESGVHCSRINTSNKAGEWQCSAALTDNLGLGESAPSVELRQPNGDTLEVIRRDDKGGVIGSHTLKRGKEFSCDAESLYFSGTASAMPGALGAFGVMVLSGGVLNHTRSFARDSDGGLVMTVRSRQLMFLYGLPMGSSETSHMRWPPAVLPEGADR